MKSGFSRHPTKFSQGAGLWRAVGVSPHLLSELLFFTCHYCSSCEAIPGNMLEKVECVAPVTRAEDRAHTQGLKWSRLGGCLAKETVGAIGTCWLVL